MRSELNIIRRDWSEFNRPVLMLTVAMFVTVFLTRLSPDFSRGLLAGLMISAGYGYAQFCFFTERQRRTLDLLLSLPIRPQNLVLSKYASAYSMTLFTVNVPDVFLGNARELFLINAAAIFMATLCMTPTVLSEKPWATQVPIWIFVLVVFPAKTLLAQHFPAAYAMLAAAGSYPMLLATSALVLSPMVAVVAALAFARRSCS